MIHAPFRNKGFIPQLPALLLPRALRCWTSGHGLWQERLTLPKSTSLPKAACVHRLASVGLCRPSLLPNLRQLRKAIPVPELSMGVASFFLCLTLDPPFRFRRYRFLNTSLKVRVYLSGYPGCGNILACSSPEESQSAKRDLCDCFRRFLNGKNTLHIPQCDFST